MSKQKPHKLSTPKLAHQSGPQQVSPPMLKGSGTVVIKSLKNQFEPTAQRPIRRRAKMSGV